MTNLFILKPPALHAIDGNVANKNRDENSEGQIYCQNKNAYSEQNLVLKPFFPILLWNHYKARAADTHASQSRHEQHYKKYGDNHFYILPHEKNLLLNILHFMSRNFKPKFPFPHRPFSVP